MMLAYEVPMTPARGEALRRARREFVNEVELSNDVIERVWAWDEKKNQLRVFLKPESYIARNHKKFMEDLKGFADAEIWEHIRSPKMNYRFIRRFTEDPKRFDELEWVDLTKQCHCANMKVHIETKGD